MIQSIRVLGGFAGFLLAITASAPSADAAVAANLCYRTAADFQTLALDPTSRISVVNRGGLLGGGVCWWHSRLQRAAIYLAMFRPDLPKVSHDQGLAIINTLANMNQVVVIAGYADFNDFSRDYENEIISRLESWQRSDGFLGFRWVDGLKGHSQLPPATLQSIMVRINQLVGVEHHILFEKLHLPSVTSHAYLVIGSRQTSDGYDLDVIDSNYPGDTKTISYKYGQSSLSKSDDGEAFIPYLDFGADMNKISSTVQSYCGKSYVNQQL